MIPAEVVRMIFPNERAGNKRVTHFSTGSINILLPWQKEHGLTVCDGDVEPRRDDTGLVQSTIQLDDNLSSSVVIDNLEFAYVACTNQY